MNEVGDWACTCGDWHPDALAECPDDGTQIIASGEDWW